MNEKEIIKDISSNDPLKVILVLQNLAKNPFENYSSELLEKLVELTKNKDIGLKFWAKKALASSKVSENSEEMSESLPDNLSIDGLFEKLNTAPSHFVAIEVLVKIFAKRDPLSYQRLIDYLNSCQDSVISSHLVKNLCIYFPTEATLKVISPYLKHPDDRVIANAFEGLEFIDSPKSTLLITQMLGHENHRVRANAAKALAKKDPDATKKVIRVMINAKDRPHFIIAACHAISQLQAKEFLPELASLAENPILSEMAVCAIKNIGGPEAVAYLESLAETEDRETLGHASKALKSLVEAPSSKVEHTTVEEPSNSGSKKITTEGQSPLTNSEATPEHQRDSGSEEQANPQTTQSSDLVCVYKRFFSFAIDGIFFNAIVLPIYTVRLILYKMEILRFIGSMLDTFIFFLPGILFALKDIVNGQSPGKIVTGLQVTDENGLVAGTKKLLLRNIVFSIPIVSSFFLLLETGFLRFSSSHNRLGDMIATTRVVNLNPERFNSNITLLWALLTITVGAIVIVIFYSTLGYVFGPIVPKP